MNVMEALTSRRSIRSFKGKISEEELKSIILAAQTSAIGRAKYDTVRMTVISDPGLLQDIDANAAAMFMKPDIHPLYGAPTLIIVSTHITGKATDNAAYSNAATMVENMVLEAVELGVGACHIWGATTALAGNSKLTARLGLPEGFTPVCAVALGRTDEKYEKRSIDEERIAVDYI